MMLIEETEVPTAALPVAAFREHLRIGSGFAEDGLQDGVLAGYLRAAMAAIEGRTGKILLEREFTWSLSQWRAPDRQVLPVAPISAVTGITLEPHEGAVETFAPACWRLLPDMQRPAIEALSGALPAIGAGGTVRIGFLAGYGPDWSDLPADLSHAVLMLAAHYYEFRHDTGLGSGCMSFGVTALIERFRTVRLMAGSRA